MNAIYCNKSTKDLHKFKAMRTLQLLNTFLKTFFKLNELILI